MAATAARPLPHIPVGEYLGSVYRPDVDYVDGELEERNAGEFDHADVQLALVRVLDPLRVQGFRAIAEARVQVSETRFRVPDVCLLPQGWKRTQIIVTPPLLCIEVLSPRDTVMGMRVRCEDYLRMGVPTVWLFDPRERKAYVLTRDGMREVSQGVLRILGVPVEADVQAIFSVLDDE